MNKFLLASLLSVGLFGQSVEPASFSIDASAMHLTHARRLDGLYSVTLLPLKLGTNARCGVLFGGSNNDPGPGKLTTDYVTYGAAVSFPHVIVSAGIIQLQLYGTLSPSNRIHMIVHTKEDRKFLKAAFYVTPGISVHAGVAEHMSFVGAGLTF